MMWRDWTFLDHGKCLDKGGQSQGCVLQTPGRWSSQTSPSEKARDVGAKMINLIKCFSKGLLGTRGCTILSVRFWQVIFYAEIMGFNSILIVMESRTANPLLSF